MEDSRFFIAGWLIDGSGGQIKKNIIIQIKKGYIRSIKPCDRFLDKTRAVDLTGHTILPCLTDSHVHLSMSGTDDQEIRKRQLNADFDYIKKNIKHHIQQHILFGVLGIRDGGDSRAHALNYKNRYLAPLTIPLALKVAGRAWHKPGRYGKIIGRVPPENYTLAQAIEGEKANIDHVKIVNSGLNSLKVFGKETMPQFYLKEMKAAVKASVSRGFKVMVHANGKNPVGIAVEAGCHSIEHGFFMGYENLQKMVDKDVTWVPTACTMKAYSEKFENFSIEAQICKKNLDHQISQISKARELGIKVALGTDSGSLGVNHGRAVIEELELLIKAGFSIQEAVKCATHNGTRLLGITEFGILTKNMPATFIAVKGEPEKLPNSLKKIANIYVLGQPLKK